jgi:alkylhydroperoxidase family enzyme
MACLYAYAISHASDCPLCSTFFRKIIIDAGEKPETLEITQCQQDLLDFGSSIAKHHGNIADHVYNALAVQYSNDNVIVLIAFAGQMVATNVLNNVIETDIDEYLVEYLPSMK